MNMFPDVVTIINTTNTKGAKTYTYNVVSGVLFESTKKWITKEYGADNADSKICYIPIKSLGNKYIDSTEYAQLDVSVRGQYITLQKGDFIVKGIATGVAINDLYSQFSEVLRISSIDIMLRGSLPHFEVLGS